MYRTAYAPAHTLVPMPRKTPGEIFKQLREQRGWSFRVAGQNAGLAHGTIQKVENDELAAGSATMRTIEGLARAYEISEQTVHDIFDGRYSDIDDIDDYLQRVKRFEVHPDWVAIPVYGSVSAGEEDADPNWSDVTFVPRESLRRKGSDPTRVRAYKVNGSCMISSEARRLEKNYAPGDTVVVDPTRGYEPGDVVVAWWEAQQTLVIKRFQYEMENIVLYPAAPGRPSVVLAHEDQTHIIGPVIWRGG